MAQLAVPPGGSVLVIGGGVVGLACAFSLRNRGFEVTVVDAAAMGEGASSGNGGWICPSLSGPVPAPGVISQAARWLLRSDSPLLVRPGWNPQFWGWLLSFARHCNRKDFQSGLWAVSQLGASSMLLFDALEASGVEFERHHQGVLLLFKTLEAARAEMDALIFMASLGCPAARWIDQEELGAIEASITGRSHIGILAPEDEHVRPETLMQGLASWLSASGVRLRPGVAISRLRTSRARATDAISTGGEEITADAFVVAAGVPTRALSRGLGTDLPLVGGKGYSMTFPGSEPTLSHALYLSEARVALSPYRDGVRVLGTMELGTASASIDQRRIEAMVRACARDLPGLQLTGSGVPWAGLRPMVPDGLPVIGASPGVGNVVIATGHAMLGVTLAPATGELVADILERRQLPPFATQLSPGRFRSAAA